MLDSIAALGRSVWGFAIVLLWIMLPAASVLGTEANDTNQSAIRLETMVVTARGTACPISQTPGSVGVITAADVERREAETLADIARRIAGIEKSSDSSWGPEINIRGLGRNRIVFLVDGCRVNTATDINAQFGLVNPDDIQRIEVLKGPISALYGSGSIGGVVNVITKKGRFAPTPEGRGEILARCGNNPGGNAIYANTSGQDRDFWLLASGGYRDHGNRTAGGGQILANSQYRDEHAKAAGAYRWNPAHTTEFQVQHVEGYDIGIPGKGLSLPEGPHVTYPRISRTLSALTHIVKPAAGVLESSEVKLYLQAIERRVRLDRFPTGSPMAITEPAADHRTLGLKWTNHLDWARHGVALGADIWRWQIDNTGRIKTLNSGAVGIDSALGDLDQENYGLFAEENWQATENLTLNLGGRIDAVASECDALYDWIKPPNAAITPALKRQGQAHRDVSWQGHAGLTWQVDENWSSTLIAASSFRAPDLMDRYKYIALGGGMELYGNPELDPERSLFLETGLFWTTNQWRVSAAAYANFLKDLITEKAVTAALRRLENIDRASILGGEMEARWQFARAWQAVGDIAWIRGRNETADEPLSFIAPLGGHVGLVYRPDAGEGFWFEAELEWAAAQRAVPAGVQPSASWQTVSIRAGYRFKLLGLAHAVSAAATNLFDETYRNHLSTTRGIDLKEPGIGLWCQWKIEF